LAEDVINYMHWGAAAGLGALVLRIGLFAIHRLNQLKHWQRFQVDSKRAQGAQIQRALSESRNPRTEVSFRPAWKGARRMKVVRREQACEGIASFYLEPCDQKPIPVFRPGQHLTLYWDKLADKKKIRRCYSLSSNPLQTQQLRLSVKLQEYNDGTKGFVSNHLHSNVWEGDQLFVHAPQGHFYWDERLEKAPVFVATGIGITPFISMVHGVVGAGKAPSEAWLFWGCRTRDHIPFREEFKALKEAYPSLRIILALSKETDWKEEWVDECVLGERLSLETITSRLPSRDFHFFLCGSQNMMESFSEGLKSWGVPKAHVEFESFGGRTTAKKKVTRPKVQNSGLEIKLARSDSNAAFVEGYENLLELLEEMEAPVGVGCRTGNCGACAVTCLAGEVEHSREPGYALDSSQLLPCIAIPKTPLELDL